MAEIRSTAEADRHFYAYDNIPETELARDTNATEPHARRMMSMVGRLVKHSVLIRQSTNDVTDTFGTSRLGGEWAHESGPLQMSDTPLRRIFGRAANHS